MTAVDVAAIRAALDRATPSDWVREGSEVYRGCTCNGEFLTSTTHDADAELIVLLRNNAEALLDALAEAEAKVAKFDNILSQYENGRISKVACVSLMLNAADWVSP